MIALRDAEPEDMDWIVPFLDGFGAPRVIVDGIFYDVRDAPAIVAERDGGPVGVLAYWVAERTTIGLAIRTTKVKAGIGRTLMRAMRDKTKALGKEKFVFTTTNDNVAAQALHASMGCKMVRRDVGGFSKVLELLGHDPSRVRMIGQNGQPITDVLHYEWPVAED